MNKPCENFLAALPDYPWLGPRERAPLDHHAAECPRCREQWRAAQLLDELFAEVRVRAPAGLPDAVMSAIEPKPRVSAGWLAAMLASALAVEVAVAVALRINPVSWWGAAMSWGEQLGREWFAPLMAAWDWVPSFDATLWGGALAVVAAFSWFTLNHWRTEHA